MKTWKIEIKSPDEQTALDYLNMLISSFKASVTMKEDMNHCIIEDSKKNEWVICNLVKK